MSHRDQTRFLHVLASHEVVLEGSWEKGITTPQKWPSGLFGFINSRLDNLVTVNRFKTFQGLALRQSSLFTVAKVPYKLCW